MSASTFWSLHTHTRESAVDALPSVKRVVAKAAELGYPALGITDHGTMSGAIEFYLECKRHDIKPLIGVEAYFTFDRLASQRPPLVHLGIVAYTEVGYRNLCWLVTLSNLNHHYRPVLDYADLAAAKEVNRLEGLLVITGCWFGLLPTMLREGDVSSVPNVLKALDSWFNNMLFVEIQNHQIHDATHNDELHARLLHDIAMANQLKTVITQDSHYIEARDQKVHDAFKSLVSWNKEDPDSAIFPGDGYHMVDTEWMEEHHAPDIFDRAMLGLKLIADRATLAIPELEHYQLQVPDTTMSGDPDTELLMLVSQAMGDFQATSKVPKSKHDVYADRVHEEVDVIRESGFAGYLMLVKTVCDYLRAADIRFRVRGSATGSLVCWLLGITGYDPVKWGLSFDRFLSRDRAKPPDIDLDVEHERRREAVDWLKEKFYVAQISTTTQFGIRGDDDDPKGSLIITFKSRQRNVGADPDAPIPEYWFRRLEAIAHYNGVRKDGTTIDPPIKGVGQHPAGLILAPNAETLDKIPMRYIASSGSLVSSFTQNWVEALGLVKLDVLGLRTLTAVRIAEEIAEVRCEDFPLTDRAVYNRIAKGKTAGLFQLEGGSAAWGVQRMRPSKISDVIAAMALFRPATMDSGATDAYLSRRNGTAQIPERHPLIAKHTSDTYGVLIYQEQALDILKDLGLSVEEIERARKAIKASNANVGNAAQALDDLMEHITALALGQGFEQGDLDFLTNALHAYAGYSFNRAHATAYGILAYQTAYLAEHHPLAFWTGTLVANEDAPPGPRGIKPEEKYLRAAKADGIRVRPPHVNRSDVTYCTDGDFIYKGLKSIKGVGNVAAQELVTHQPYQSLDDLARRVAPRRVTGTKDLGKGHTPDACPGTVKALYEASALYGLTRETE